MIYIIKLLKYLFTLLLHFSKKYYIYIDEKIFRKTINIKIFYKIKKNSKNILIRNLTNINFYIIAFFLIDLIQYKDKFDNYLNKIIFYLMSHN